MTDNPTPPPLSAAEQMREDAARVVDQANADGPYQAIAAASTIRALPLPADPEMDALAAFQCIFTDGKTGLVCDEHGNQFCAMQRRAETAEAERDALVAAAYARGWADALASIQPKEPDHE